MMNKLVEIWFMGFGCAACAVCLWILVKSVN